MDRLDELNVFLAILDTGSLAAAGRKLMRSPPSVTRVLGTLEQRLGARLIERSTRRLMPTEAGLQFAQQARRVLGEYEAALASHAPATPRGTLRITAPVVFGRRHVTPLVARFLASYPQIQANIVLADRNVDLIEDGIDVAFRIGPLPDSGMVARRLGEVRRMLVASPAYLKRHGAPQQPSDLAAHDIVLNTTARPLPEWRFRQNGRDLAVRFQPRLQLNDVDATLNTVRGGFGIGRFLSYQVADDLKKGKLAPLLEAYEPPPLPVHLLVPSGRHMPSRLRTFVEYAIAHYATLDVIHSSASISK
jgi:DNA-binding transcriptional LysR family regulator